MLRTQVAQARGVLGLTPGNFTSLVSITITLVNSLPIKNAVHVRITVPLPCVDYHFILTGSPVHDSDYDPHQYMDHTEGGNHGVWDRRRGRIQFVIVTFSYW